MRRAWVGVLVGLGLAGGGIALAAPPRSAPLQKVDADAGRVAQLRLPPELRAKLPGAAQELLARLDDDSARADAAARGLAEVIAQALANAGTTVDPKTVEALSDAIMGEAAAAAAALASAITTAIAELSYIDRCDGSKDCAADPTKLGVTAEGVKKMRERIAAEKTTARALLVSQRAALAKVTKKRARLEVALPSLRADAGTAR